MTWQELALQSRWTAALDALVQERGELPLLDLGRLISHYTDADRDDVSDAVERYVIDRHLNTGRRALWARVVQRLTRRGAPPPTGEQPHRRSSGTRSKRNGIGGHIIRESITMEDLLLWCRDRTFWLTTGGAGQVRDLLGSLPDESKKLLVYIVRYPSDAIDVHELVVTETDCWVPGDLLLTISPPQKSINRAGASAR